MKLRRVDLGRSAQGDARGWVSRRGAAQRKQESDEAKQARPSDVTTMWV